MSKRRVCYLGNKPELAAWLDRQPNRSAVMVAALEMYRARQAGELENQPLDTEAIRQVMREELARVSITNGTGGPILAEGDENPDVTQGIGALAGAWDFDDDEEADG